MPCPRRPIRSPWHGFSTRAGCDVRRKTHGLKIRATDRFLVGLIVALLPSIAFADSPAPTTRPASFSRDIAPLLLKQCQTCHGPDKSKGKYRLDTFQRFMTPGKSKAAPVTPGHPEKSKLYRLITSSDEDERMPQKADRLPDPQIAAVRDWIAQGAAFDGPDPGGSLASLGGSADHPAPPAVYLRPIPVTAIAFSPDGKTLAVSGYHEVTLWDPADAKLVGRIERLSERTWGLAYSPDGKLLAVAGGDPGLSGELRLCDPAARTPGKVLERIADMMLVVRFSPDGTKLAAGGADNAVRVYDIQSGKRELLIEQHADWITDLTFSPDGARIATASRDKSARVFDAKTGEMQAAYLKHEEALTGIAWNDDGEFIFSVGRDRKIRAWNSADGKDLKPPVQIGGFEGDPFKLATAPGLVFACSADGTVREFSQEKRQLVQTFTRAEDWVYCLAPDAKSHRLAGGCYNGQVDVWDTDTGKIITTFLAAPGIATAHPR
jgi:WD40 repeat protein/mono/diheme cytochrome c family protein